MIIDSLENKKIKEYLKLHHKKYRDRNKMFIVEEEHLILEAINTSSLITLIILENTNDYNFDNVIYVSPKVMDKLSQNKSKVNCIGICKIPNVTINNYNRVVILDKIGDPANMGAIIRNAVCFGYDQIIVSNDSVDVYNEKSIRASQGAIFKINIIRSELIDEINKLKALGFMLIGTTLTNSIEINELEVNSKMAFVFGNEGSGINGDIIKELDINVRIPLVNFDSLNVSCASAIVMNLYNGINV